MKLRFAFRDIHIVWSNTVGVLGFFSVCGTIDALYIRIYIDDSVLTL